MVTKEIEEIGKRGHSSFILNSNLQALSLDFFESHHSPCGLPNGGYTLLNPGHSNNCFSMPAGSCSLNKGGEKNECTRAD